MIAYLINILVFVLIGALLVLLGRQWKSTAAGFLAGSLWLTSWSVAYIFQAQLLFLLCVTFFVAGLQSFLRRPPGRNPGFAFAAGSLAAGLAFSNRGYSGVLVFSMTITVLFYPLAASAGPGAVTLTSPLGSISASSVPSTVTFSWEAVSDATRYYLKVTYGTGRRAKFRSWYSAADAGCSSGTTGCR